MAAVTTLRGVSPHNKNSQLSFVVNPRFPYTYTTFGWVMEELGGEIYDMKVKLVDNVSDTEKKAVKEKI